MKNIQIKWVDQIPHWPEFSSKYLWQKIRNDENLKKYFPDYS